jgi:alpha-galactosidase
MSKALAATGRPIVFSLCEWGQNKPWEWASNVGHLWRTTGDISNVFAGTKNMGTWQALAVLKIIDLQKRLRAYAGPGHCNDPDMLEVGNGLTDAENRDHFSMWCMLASPLMAGNDLRKMTEATKNVLTNKNVIAVGQDPLGIGGFAYTEKDSVETWLKPLQNGDWAVCFMNRSNKPVKFSMDWKQHPIVDTLSKATLNAVTNIYNIKKL